MTYNGPKSKKGKIAAFIFQWLFDNDYIYPRRITCGNCYDNECEFLHDFCVAFPGRPPNHSITAKRRLAKYLNELSADGWLSKNTTYNDKHYLGEMKSGYYPDYSLSRRMALRIENGFETADEWARKWAG